MMWLVRSFWKLSGVFTADLSYNEFQHTYSLILLATCVHNFLVASQYLCRLDRWCVIFSSTLVGMYDRVLAVTTILSRIAVIYRSERNTSRYKSIITAFEVYSPTSAAETTSYKIFSSAVVVLCLTIIVPVNAISLYFLWSPETRVDRSLLVYNVFYYIQNLSMCCIETQFVTQCFRVYTKFRGINGDLAKLKDMNVDRAKYPFTSHGGPVYRTDRGKSLLQCAVLYHKDFYRPRFNSHPMANTVEILRIRHWLIRQSIDSLNNMFGIHMGLSVFYLWLVALFDVYYEIFRNSPSEWLVYAWMLQYTFRTLMIILAAHFMTKQALRSKSLITDTNNSILDSSTKEEAIAAGATYLVILVQFHSDRN